MNILINEVIPSPALLGLIRFKSFSEIKTGIYSLKERLKLLHPGCRIYYLHKDPIFTSLYLERNTDVRQYSGEDIDLEFSADDSFSPWNLIDRISSNIEQDVKLFRSSLNYSSLSTSENRSLTIIGDPSGLFIDNTAKISPGVIFDLSKGPVVIQEDVTITAFSYIAGPAVLGPRSQISFSRLNSECIIGEESKISGEITKTIFGNFSNKAHDGLIKNSFIGDWVNIAALSSTTNYNFPMCQTKTVEIPDNLKVEINEDFGVVICDFCRVSGAMLMQSGSYLDFGSALWADKMSGYYPTFVHMDRKKKYLLEDFLEHSSKQMQRRNRFMSSREISLLRQIYRSANQ